MIKIIMLLKLIIMKQKNIWFGCKIPKAQHNITYLQKIAFAEK